MLWQEFIHLKENKGLSIEQLRRNYMWYLQFDEQYNFKPRGGPDSISTPPLYLWTTSLEPTSFPTPDDQIILAEMFGQYYSLNTYQEVIEAQNSLYPTIEFGYTGPWAITPSILYLWFITPYNVEPLVTFVTSNFDIINPIWNGPTIITNKSNLAKGCFTYTITDYIVKGNTFRFFPNFWWFNVSPGTNHIEPLQAYLGKNAEITANVVGDDLVVQANNYYSDISLNSSSIRNILDEIFPINNCV